MTGTGQSSHGLQYCILVERGRVACRLAWMVYLICAIKTSDFTETESTKSELNNIGWSAIWVTKDLTIDVVVIIYITCSNRSVYIPAI